MSIEMNKGVQIQEINLWVLITLVTRNSYLGLKPNKTLSITLTIWRLKIFIEIEGKIQKKALG